MSEEYGFMGLTPCTCRQLDVSEDTHRLRLQGPTQAQKHQVAGRKLSSACAGFLLGLLIHPKDGGDM
jgi:hypothetical protein